MAKMPTDLPLFWADDAKEHLINLISFWHYSVVIPKWICKLIEAENAQKNNFNLRS